MSKIHADPGSSQKYIAKRPSQNLLTHTIMLVTFSCGWLEATPTPLIFSGQQVGHPRNDV
jgi:hypothetical protein